MNLDDFSYTENDRRYINPQVSLDEQNAFIDNLRNMQQTDTAQITQDTHNLGTDLPSNLGGLSGGANYFKSRYQTPQTNSMISDLRATAQANALSTLMNNEIAKAKKRYNDAYRAAKKRSGSGGSGGSSLADLLNKLGLGTSNKYGATNKKDADWAGSLGDAEHRKKYDDFKRSEFDTLNKEIGAKGLENMVDLNNPDDVGDFIRDYWFKYNESGYYDPFNK